LQRHRGKTKKRDSNQGKKKKKRREKGEKKPRRNPKAFFLFWESPHGREKGEKKKGGRERRKRKRGEGNACRKFRALFIARHRGHKKGGKGSDSGEGGKKG